MSVTEENWTYNIRLNEVENHEFCDFELHKNEIYNQVLLLLKNSFMQHINYQCNSTQSNDEKRKLLVENNKKLLEEIDDKLKEMSRQKMQYEIYKQDQKLLSQEIKETHEAFLMAKKYYKKFLKMYYSIESKIEDKQIIYIQFFTETKKDSENFSVRLARNMKTKQYELLSATPKIAVLKEYQRILLETNDVPGALYSIREEFLALKRAK